MNITINTIEDLKELAKSNQFDIYIQIPTTQYGCNILRDLVSQQTMRFCKEYLFYISKETSIIYFNLNSLSFTYIISKTLLPVIILTDKQIKPLIDKDKQTKLNKLHKQLVSILRQADEIDCVGFDCNKCPFNVRDDDCLLSMLYDLIYTKESDIDTDKDS